MYPKFQELIKDKWNDEDGHPRMIHKMNHLYTFMLNAEHHCRLDMYPFPGKPDDGTFHDYDDIWQGTSRKSGHNYGEKMSVLNDGFQRYIAHYYYRSEVKHFWPHFVAIWAKFSVHI